MSALFKNPRPKTYAAQSGFVYQYIFEGLRDTGAYSFRVSSGPQIEMLVDVELAHNFLTEWMEQNGPLSDIEKFGIAKMALLRALDEIAEPGNGTVEVQPEPDDIAQICRDLDFVE